MSIDNIEPVAWMRHDGGRVTTAADRKDYPDYETRYPIPLYTRAQLEQAVKDERESCARECEDGASTNEELICAKLIRARGASMTDRYVSDRCEDLVDVVDGVSVVTQGLGYYNQGDVRCEVRETGNGFIALFPAHTSIQQDYYICMDYAQARDLVLALSKFKAALGFKEQA